MSHQVYIRPMQPNAQPIFLDGAGEMRWDFIHGGETHRGTLVVSSSVDEQLIAAGALAPDTGPWELALAGTDKRVRFLWLTDRRGAIGPDKIEWTLVDRRFALEGWLVDVEVNRMRQVDDFDRPDPSPISPEVSLFAQVNRRQLVPAFCRNSTDPLTSRFYDPILSPVNEEQHQPWTALSFLIWLLRDDGYLAEHPIVDLNGQPFQFVGGGPLVDRRVRERKIILTPGFNPRSSFAEAINTLCRLARVLVYVNRDGRFVITTSDPLDHWIFSADYGNYEKSNRGIATRYDFRRSAPRISRVHFPEWLEIRWQYDELEMERMLGIQTQTFPQRSVLPAPNTLTARNLLSAPKGGKAGQSFWLMNVMKVPQDTSRHLKGQWGEYFNVLYDWQQDNAIFAGLTGLRGDVTQVFCPEVVRALIKSPGLANYWIRDQNRLEYRDPILEARVSTVYSYYRRYFQIPEFWMDYIRNIKVETAEVFSTTTRSRQPPPLWVDYHSWDSTVNRVRGARPQAPTPHGAERGEGFLRNFPVDDQDSGWFTRANATNRDYMKRVSEFNLDDMTPAPGMVKLVDRDLGVISYDLIPDLEGVTVERAPGLTYIDDTYGGPEAGMRFRLRTADRLTGGQNLYGILALAPHFRFATILRCLWLNPNSPQRFYTLTADGNGYIPGAAGPVHDTMFGSFEAIKAWRDGEVTVPDKATLKVVHDGPVSNLSLLRELAEGRRQNIYYEFLPKILGTFRVKGWNGQEPLGQVRRSAVVFQNGALETEITASQDAPPPNPIEFLSPENRNLFLKLQENTP